MIALMLASLLAAGPAAPGPKTLLVGCGPAGQGRNFVARGLDALQIPYEGIEVDQYRGVSPFDYDLII